MEKDLKMEVFASVDTVKPVEFHVYELHAQKIGNTYSIIRGAAWKLRNWNQAYLKMETKSMRRKNCKRKSQMLILQSNMRDHENCLF